MNINLDEKKIKNIVYLTRNGKPVNLVLKNGELVDITDIPVKYKTDIERENAWVKDTLDASREKKWKECGIEPSNKIFDFNNENVSYEEPLMGASDNEIKEFNRQISKIEKMKLNEPED